MACTLLSSAALAVEAPNPTCAAGQALTSTIQCDPGTRGGVDRTWLPQGAGVEICKVSQPRCEPIKYPSATARPGFEVQDSSWGSLVAVTFGLDRLLGEPRP